VPRKPAKAQSSGTATVIGHGGNAKDSMALEHAHGTIRWLAADAVSTVYTVSGLSFQPKALRFYWQGLGNATDQASQTIHSRRGVGFCTSTSLRRAVGSQDQDAAGTMVCTSGLRNDCVAFSLTSTPAADGLLDINAINSDGFSLIVDDQGVVDLAIHWEAWGGTDITVATVIDIAEPAATGDVDYTVTGFTSGATNQVVMFAGVQSTAAANTATRADSGLCVGFAAGINAADNVHVEGNNDDASTTADTDGYCKTGECLGMIAVAGGNPTARAQLTLFGTDNFRLNWIARATTSRRYIALAIKGGGWKSGALTIDGSTLNATATVSSLPFAPKGLSLMGRMSIEQTAATSVIEDRMSLGSGSSISSRRCQGTWSEDNSITGSSVCEIDLVLEYDQVLAYPTNAGAVTAAKDIDLMNGSSFRLIVDATGGVASEWIGYLTFGDEPADIQEGDGNSAGAAASSVVGAALTLADGDSDGVAIPSGAGVTLTQTTASSSGAATASANSAIVIAGDASSTGTSTANAPANSVATSSASAAGIAVADAPSSAIAQVVVSSDGVATGSGVGVSFAQTTAASAGVAVGNGSAAAIVTTNGSSAGVAVGADVGAAIATTVYSSTGVATVLGEGANGAETGSDFDADGVAIVLGVGASMTQANGSSTGTSTVDGLTSSVFNGVANSAGVATVLGEGANAAAGGIVEAVANASGVATVNGISDAEPSEPIGPTIGVFEQRSTLVVRPSTRFTVKFNTGRRQTVKLG